jgi:hypothetical protein
LTDPLLVVITLPFITPDPINKKYNHSASTATLMVDLKGVEASITGDPAMTAYGFMDPINKKSKF